MTFRNQLFWLKPIDLFVVLQLKLEAIEHVGLSIATGFSLWSKKYTAGFSQIFIEKQYRLFSYLKLYQKISHIIESMPRWRTHVIQFSFS
jgi:hypothetical protein